MMDSHEPNDGLLAMVSFDKSLPMLAYEGREISRLLAIWIEETFGMRCQEPSEGCPCCKAWKSYDKVAKILEGMA